MLQAKTAKLESLNRERAADCDRARQQLEDKVKAAQALGANLENVKRELQEVEVWCFNGS